MSEIRDFARSTIADVLATAEAESASAPEVYTQMAFDALEQAGVTDNTFYAFHKVRGLEVHGFARNDTLESLDLFVTDFDQRDPDRKLSKAEAVALLKRLWTFMDRCRAGFSSELDDTTDLHDMCLAVEKALPEVRQIRLFLLTNANSTTTSIPSTAFEGIPVRYEVWDNGRFHRLASSGTLSEPIIVELAEPLPCLATPETDKDYSVLLAIVPGQALADLYGEYGTRLLQLNVRSFLQARGAVNKGIRETLMSRPERFLAYNNGISATASRIDFVDLPGGATGIKRIHDLQIVNGGQTTASLHYTAARDKADLADVFVQAKITVVSPVRLDEIVSSISLYSNTQNKVTVVDLSANNPFHVALEQVTRSLWAPATAGTGQETRWFYERARGQYSDAMARERTPARQKSFQLVHPIRQKFQKSDVAKYENSWSQLPHIVSRGAEKNFREFMDKLGEHPPSVDVAYCQRLIAKGILFKESERIVSAQNFGGYRANIVTYSIAKVANAAAQRVDLDRVWREQALSSALREAIAEISHLVHSVIISPPPRMAHVGEWTKKVECWNRVEQLEWSMPASLRAELLDAGAARSVVAAAAEAGLSPVEKETLETASAVASEDWFAVSAWAKQTENLQPWQRQIAFSLGKLAGQGRTPSIKQAVQGVKLLNEAARLGFQRPSEVA